MARALRLQNVNGDGSPAADQTFPFYPDVDANGKPFCDDAGVPWVEITLRPISRDQHRAFVKARTTREQVGRGPLEERIDHEKVDEDLVVAAVVSWRGIVGADDKPLACIDGTKRALDAFLRTQIRNRAMFAQPAEVTAESFRQPAPVP